MGSNKLIIIYFKYFSFVGPIELVVHRALWTSVLLIFTTTFFSKWNLFFIQLKDIKKNEELSYDYGFSFDCDYKDHVCKCGSKNCVGFIVREGSRWRIPGVRSKF